MRASLKSCLLVVFAFVALAVPFSPAAQAQDNTAITAKVGYFNLIQLKQADNSYSDANRLSNAVGNVAQKFDLDIAVDAGAVFCGGQLIVDNGIDLTSALETYRKSGSLDSVIAHRTAKPITARFVCFDLRQIKANDPASEETEMSRSQANAQVNKALNDSNAALENMKAQGKSKAEIVAAARTLQIELNAKQKALIDLIQAKQKKNTANVASAVAICAREKHFNIAFDEAGVFWGVENIKEPKVTNEIIAIMQPNMVPNSSISSSSSSSSGAEGATGLAMVPGSASPPAASDDVIRDKWAVVIGITNFANPAYNLRYSAKDAVDFSNYLIKEGYFRPDHVLTLVDEQATRANIMRAFGSKWLPMLAEPGDLVVIYISTHGTPASSDSGGRNYTVAYDTDASDLYATGVDMDELARRMKEIQSDRAVIILDTCFSGGGVPGARAIGRYDSFDVSKIQVGHGQLIMSASSPNERSWESRNAQNGVFTRHLIDNLRTGSKVDIRDAFSKCQTDTKWEVKRDYGVPQTPQLGGNWQGKPLILSLPASQPRTMSSAKFLDFGPGVAKNLGGTVAPPPAVKH